MDKKTALVEAVLFLENEPVNLSNLAIYTGLNETDVQMALDELIDRSAHLEFALAPIQIDGCWMLSIKEGVWADLKGHYGKRREERLSRAALETLSIIAYSQPITRSEIENLRGVGADNIIKTLKDKNLVQEVGRKDTPGRPVMYGTTEQFLKVFRLNSIAALPKLDELDEERFAE